ncbi:glycine/sarcosine/betaine reductase selenoprotein B family protein [Geotalea toluenoxydans]|uniref:glycine/sarcosine/betaine reductase selenoprotein B family protein n=1 Tax=Geotalea toluenoxydans TaxID=421624 RepID=UPI0006D2C7CC|nr:glycine/sarcosine/betaine reductase selenoprotein B family protein [Geotalea toluenoxydans]
MSYLDVEGEYVRGKVLPDFQWASFAEPTEATPLKKPINECSIALVVTAGAYLAESQTRFDTRNPLGDDSYRIIPSNTPSEQISLSHPGYDTRRALNDLDTVFPFQLLGRMQENGTIGAVAPRHFSFMGYIPRTERLLWNNAPQVARMLRDDGVDLAILVPS